MPIYEYKCEKCGKEFEELVFGSDEEVECTACGSTKTSRLMSCCRHKSGGGGGGLDMAGPAPSSGGGSGCSGCSGGDCSSCG